MNANPAKPSPINDSSHCTQRFANGKRCTNPAQPDSSLCPSHAKLSANRREAADLSATLTGGLDQFKSPAAINDFLSRLLLLLAQDRISSRRAAVLAYITNQLLRTVSAMEQEAASDQKNLHVDYIINIPRPPREPEEVAGHNALPREPGPMSKCP